MKRAFADYLVQTQRVTTAAINALPQDGWGSREPIGRLALMHNLLSPLDIDWVLSEQKTGGDYFGQIAIRMGLMTEAQLRLLLAGQAVRSCLELLEDLVLAGHIALHEGLQAISEFVARVDFCTGVPAEAIVSDPPP